MPSRRAESLNPTLPDRIRQALQPDWVHTARARRIAAAGLVVLAAVIAIRAEPGGEHAPAAIAVHDLPPGTAITADDIRVENRLASTLPDGSQSDPAAFVGATPAGPIRRGEIITDVRLLGPRLAQAAAGPDARLVPLHVTDKALPDLLRPGDVVDIVAAPASTPTPPRARWPPTQWSRRSRPGPGRRRFPTIVSCSLRCPSPPPMPSRAPAWCRASH